VVKYITNRRPSDPMKISFFGFVFVGMTWTALWMLSIVATYSRQHNTTQYEYTCILWIIIGQILASWIPKYKVQKTARTKTIHQMTVNRFSARLSLAGLYLQCGSWKEIAKDWLLLQTKWKAEYQHHFAESTDITNVLQDYMKQHQQV